jgi:glycine/D-amino acid oxidase-like deaminating enzyme
VSTSTGHQVVVIGAGVTGLITAVRCLQAGHRVTLVDRGAIPNPASSSFDQHRVLRALDPTDAQKSRRAAQAHEQWLELQNLLCEPDPGCQFYRRAGVVTAWPDDQMDKIHAIAAEAGVTVKSVDGRELHPFRFPAGTRPVLEPAAGVLLADRVLRAAARWLSNHPAAQVRPWSTVVSVDHETGKVVLQDGSVRTGDLVLIATGPWSQELVDLPTVLYRQTMVYLRPPEDLLPWWDKAPSAGRIGADARGWVVPSGGGTLLKLSTDAVCRPVDSVEGSPDGDALSWAQQIIKADLLTDIRRYTLISVKQCHYAADPAGEGGQVTRIGPVVWARAASGGDGFRTAPLVADEIVNQLNTH